MEPDDDEIEVKDYVTGVMVLQIIFCLLGILGVLPLNLLVIFSPIGMGMLFLAAGFATGILESVTIRWKKKGKK